MNHKYIIVADLETDSTPNAKTGTDEVNPTEIAAVAIHPVTLEIKEKEAFKVTVRPDQFDDENYRTKARESTIAWHADTRGVTKQDILDDWDKGISEKIAWKNFISFCNKYKVKKDPAKKLYYPEPILSGYNINGFDIPIMKRVNEKHKGTWPFSKMPTSLDLLDIIYYWFNDMPEPGDLKLDTLKAYFGLESHGQAHEALSDVIDTAKILVKFLKFARKQASYDKFHNSFK